MNDRPPTVETQVDMTGLPPEHDVNTIAIPSAQAKNGTGGKWLVRAGLMLVLVGLLYFALRKAPFLEIWNVIRLLRLWQLVLLLSIDALIYLLITARWWLIVRPEHREIRFVPLVGVRIAVFAISYFTLGPQFGGEPLQVLYLQRNHGLSYTRATASVVMDKLLELLSNFFLAILGMAAIFQSGILSIAAGAPVIITIALLIIAIWPLVHIVLLFKHKYPISAGLHVFQARLGQRKLLRFIRACEHLAGQFCQRHPEAMFAAILVSFIAGFATICEYALLISFLRVGLPFWQTVTAWAVGWFSFLVPLPGGLGAFEASQVFVLGLFGVSAGSAVGVALLIRARDLLIGGIGLLLAGNITRRI
jgi:uncharacterized protein (TIRG00374 family)